MDDERLKKAIQLIRVATEKDNAGDYLAAFQYYRSALDNWQLVTKYQTNRVLKEKLYEKMEPYLARAEAIKKYLDEKKSDVTIAEDGGPMSKSNSKEEITEKDKFLNHFEELISKETPNVRWQDVAGLDAAKGALQEAVILPSRFPELFVGKRQPWKGILLYGPPGTGKTHLAKACATETTATFFCISSADLVSKWQGESEKLVRALFDAARKNSPAIVFIDEVDSLCGARSQHDNESSRRIKTELLVQMEGGSDKSKSRVLVLGATNEPWTLDTAIRRRFEKRIYIPLPEVDARLKLLYLHIGDTPHEISEEEMLELAETTEGFSGADISVLIRNALLQPLRQCQTAKFFKKYVHQGVTKWTPCAPDDPDPTKESMTLMQIESNHLYPPGVTINDLRIALADMKPTVAQNELSKYHNWTVEFGQEG